MKSDKEIILRIIGLVAFAIIATVVIFIAFK